MKKKQTVKQRALALESKIFTGPITSTRLMFGSMGVTDALRRLVDSYEKLSCDIVAVDRHGLKSQPQWSQKPPTESGDYWWWNGDKDSAPFFLNVMRSGHKGSKTHLFVCIRYDELTRNVKDPLWRGWWLPVQAPELPVKK